MKPLRVIICKGLPASGKSTWAKEFVQKNPNFKRINKDSLRLMVDIGKFSRDNERLIEEARDCLLRLYLNRRQNVIVDDTNLNPSQPTRIREVVNEVLLDSLCPVTVKEQGVEVEEKFFHVSLDEALARNSLRTEQEGKVPASAIKNMHRKWLNKDLDRHAYRLSDPMKKQAVIFDIDGTVAIARHRDCYDESKVGTDDVNSPVVFVLDALRAAAGQLQVIFVSGRHDDCRDETWNWLRRNGIAAERDVLLMRAASDNRRDDVVKQEIFETKIDPDYSVVCAFDDRNRVVKMWRGLGVPCFQVTDGDF